MSTTAGAPSADATVSTSEISGQPPITEQPAAVETTVAQTKKRKSTWPWSKRGSTAGPRWQDADPADLLAKQTDMIDALQKVILEERWQHEQHCRVLETSLEQMHTIIKQYEQDGRPKKEEGGRR